jgi:predicted transcriptional regulator
VRAVQEKCDEKGRDPRGRNLGWLPDPIAIVLPGNTLEHLSAMSYVEREEKREQFRQDALAAWNHYQTTVLHATAEEADAWLAKLEAGKDAAPPKCHVLRAPPFASR